MTARRKVEALQLECSLQGTVAVDHEHALALRSVSGAEHKFDLCFDAVAAAVYGRGRARPGQVLYVDPCRRAGACLAMVWQGVEGGCRGGGGAPGATSCGGE